VAPAFFLFHPAAEPFCSRRDPQPHPVADAVQRSVRVPLTVAYMYIIPRAHGHQRIAAHGGFQPLELLL